MRVPAEILFDFDKDKPKPGPVSLFEQSRGALRHELTAQLRPGRVTRRLQGRVLPSGKVS